MRKRKLVAVLCLTILTSACSTKGVATTPGKPRDEKLIQITQTSARIEDGVTAAIKIKRALLADGKITKDQSAAFTDILEKITLANQQLNSRSIKFDSFAANRNDLLRLVEELAGAAAGLGGTVINGGPELTRVLAIISAGVAELRRLFL